MHRPHALAHASQLSPAQWENPFHGALLPSWAVEDELQVGEAEAQRETGLGGCWPRAAPTSVSLS